MLGPVQVVAVQTPFPADVLLDIERLSFSSDGLVIHVLSPHWEVNVTFHEYYGFRVLDELDLTAFWSECSLKQGWLFEVHANGWKALESLRPDFYSRHLGCVREFLLISRHECVSILADKEPVITAIEATPSLDHDESSTLP
ncbi:hypothetical protein [Leeia aquatica]|uniref:Uncharacterized protein n=1 Tax=Leeia aquatica TaxID=2725557 RepID=A0A847S573_9NEIS|nr:hypothetical protein [Leeia aquatica]NLR74267.1 hypothetical protein [Leeia aquatica]